MKSILMSIRPQYVAKILNGIKTIEIRKRFPVDYVGWVYIYCTKGKPYLANATELFTGKYGCLTNYDFSYEEHDLNGKVVARFWCDRVEEIKFNDKVVQEKSCLTEDELFDYLFINEPYNEDMHKGYGIYITKLEIFDKPKELSEFRPYTCNKCDFQLCRYCNIRPLTKAPQNYYYIETGD